MTTDHLTPDESTPNDAATPEPGTAGAPGAGAGSNADAHGIPTDRRPFGFWLKVVDRRLSAEMAELFDADGLTRRDWRALNLLAGAALDERLAARLAARPQLLDRLAERGWVDPESNRLTDAGRDARVSLQERVSALRERVAGAVSPEDFATTVATLETIARELGWDESQRPTRGKRGGRRFGHDHPHHGHGAPERFGHGRLRHGEFGRGEFGRGERRDPRCVEDERRTRGERRTDGDRRGRRGFGPGSGQGFGPAGSGRPAAAEVHVHVHVHEGRRHGRPGHPEPLG